MHSFITAVLYHACYGPHHLSFDGHASLSDFSMSARVHSASAGLCDVALFWPGSLGPGRCDRIADPSNLEGL